MAKLQYPILLVHGMGFRDYKVINYWGRIPKELERLGCAIFYGNQDSNGDIKTNGKIIAERIEEIIRKTGAEKVNIIAHSKGGLDSRYAISTLGMGDKVASLTTISTPHNGSKTVDKLLKAPKWLVKFVGSCTDCFFRLAGDRGPNSYGCFLAFTTAEAERFNLANPDDERVYYQSYATVMKHPFSDMFMWLTNLVVGMLEGESDGLLTPDAVRWTNFKGIYRGAGFRGISHCDQIDLRRKRLTKKEGDGISDIVDLYKEIIVVLQEKGF